MSCDVYLASDWSVQTPYSEMIGYWRERCWRHAVCLAGEESPFGAYPEHGGSVCVCVCVCVEREGGEGVCVCVCVCVRRESGEREQCARERESQMI